MEDRWGGGGVGDLEGECGGAGELDGAEVQADGRDGDWGWCGGAEEADEVERVTGVGGDLDGGDAVGGGVRCDGLRGERDDDDAAGGWEEGFAAVADKGEVGCGLNGGDVDGGGAGVGEGDGL